MALLRALIIEESACMRLYMQVILKQCGIDAIMARDGARALQRASQCGIDLIVVDTESRRTQIRDLLYSIASGAFGSAPPPVIVCTPHSGDGRYTAELREAGATALLGKPFRPVELVEAVRAAFEELEASG